MKLLKKNLFVEKIPSPLEQNTTLFFLKKNLNSPRSGRAWLLRAERMLRWIIVLRPLVHACAVWHGCFAEWWCLQGHWHSKQVWWVHYLKLVCSDIRVYVHFPIFLSISLYILYIFLIGFYLVRVSPRTSQRQTSPRSTERKLMGGLTSKPWAGNVRLEGFCLTVPGSVGVR